MSPNLTPPESLRPLRFQREGNEVVPCWGDDCPATPTHSAAVFRRGALWLIVYACDTHKAEWEGRYLDTVTVYGDTLCQVTHHRLTVRDAPPP